MNVAFWQCAPKARIISEGRFHSEIDPVADERFKQSSRPASRTMLFAAMHFGRKWHFSTNRREAIHGSCWGQSVRERALFPIIPKSVQAMAATEEYEFPSAHEGSAHQTTTAPLVAVTAGRHRETL